MIINIVLLIFFTIGLYKPIVRILNILVSFSCRRLNVDLSDDDDIIDTRFYSGSFRDSKSSNIRSSPILSGHTVTNCADKRFSNVELASISLAKSDDDELYRKFMKTKQLEKDVLDKIKNRYEPNIVKQSTFNYNGYSIPIPPSGWAGTRVQWAEVCIMDIKYQKTIKNLQI